MGEKFGRNYRLTIDPMDGGPKIVIGMPLTMNFNIQRHIMAQLNTSTIEIYNLSREVRNRIFQDRPLLGNVAKPVTLEVGYDSLYTVFTGQLFLAGHRREGTNIVTHIEAQDGYYDTVNTQIFQTYAQGKTLGDIFKFLIGQFPSLELGAVGKQTDPVLRPQVLNGNVWDLLKQYSQNKVYIDLGKVFVLKNNEAVKGQIPLLSVDSGLLDTPYREDNELTVTTLLEPRVGMGQNIELKSVILPIYNGQYRVNGVVHEGTISAAVGGNARSTFNLYLGPQSSGGLSTVV